jgi:hypothetical protein
MTATTRLVLGCIALVALSPAFAQTVYTWKDAKGVTHYSDSPPPKGTQSRQVPSQPAPPVPAAPAPNTAAQTAPASPSTNAAIAAAIDPAAVAAREKQRAESCKNAQANLKILQESYGVAVDNDGDGKSDAVLDPAQRQKETENMQLAVQANCNG